MKRKDENDIDLCACYEPEEPTPEEFIDPDDREPTLADTAIYITDENGIEYCGAAKIARVLYDERVPTPAYWHYIRQGKFDYVFADAPPDKAYSWSLAIIRTILNDETYIGNTIHHKQSTISYKNKKVVQNPKEEWVRVENTHEPIISKDLFDQVQDQIATRRRMQKDATTQIFAGLLKCADCGWSMTFARNANAKNPFGYYVCGKHRAYRYKGGECTRHYLRQRPGYSVASPLSQARARLYPPTP